MRRSVAVVLVLLLGAGGYVGLDVEDRVPGILTLDPGPTDPASVGSSGVPLRAADGTPGVPVPAAEAAPRPPLAAAGTAAPLPARGSLATVLAPALADPGLGSSVDVTVRDAATGAHLLDRDPERPGIPASTTKLLTATAVMATLDPAERLSTRAVQGAAPQDVVLVAGGDTLLAPGRGSATAVAGRAGLDDLAAQTAAALKRRGVATATLHLDDRHAAGPRYAPGWEPVDIAAGLTGAVAMLGLSTQRPRPYHPTPADPAMSAATAFRAALASARRDRGHRHRPAGRGARCGPARGRPLRTGGRPARPRPGRQRQRPHRVPGPPGRRAVRPHGRRAGVRGGRRAGYASRSGPRASTSPAPRCWTPAACPAARSSRPVSSATCWRWPPAGRCPGCVTWSPSSRWPV